MLAADGQWAKDGGDLRGESASTRSDGEDNWCAKNDQ
jgi:hypothetical protein